MNGLITALSSTGDAVATPMTMSSREIAELTDKRHDNVVRDIRVMLTELYGEGGILKFEDTHVNPQNGQSNFGLAEYADAQGKPRSEYRLPKDLTLTLVAGYNVKLRKRIIDRWMELEQAAALGAFNIPQTYTAALRLAADLSEENAVLEHKVAEQAPKVEVYDRIVEDAGTYLIRRAAKVLGVGPGKFVDWLLTHGWAYRHASKGHLLGYQDKLDKGWLAHKLTPFWNKRTQMNEVTAALRVTAEGICVLAKKIPGATL